MWVFLKESEDLLIQSGIFDHCIPSVSWCDLNIPHSVMADFPDSDVSDAHTAN